MASLSRKAYESGATLVSTTNSRLDQGILKGESITVLLTSCLTGLD